MNTQRINKTGTVVTNWKELVLGNKYDVVDKETGVVKNTGVCIDSVTASKNIAKGTIDSQPLQDMFYHMAIDTVGDCGFVVCHEDGVSITIVDETLLSHLEVRKYI